MPTAAPSPRSIPRTASVRSKTRKAAPLSFAALLLLGAPSVFAQAPMIKAPVDQPLTTNDGWRIACTYWEAVGGKESPVVILLHSRDGNQLVWKNGLAERLQQEGYAVLAVDLRKHGESKRAGGVVVENGTGTKSKTKIPKKVATAAAGDLKKDDYERMVTEDLAAVKKFLYDEHQAQRLNMRKTAIVAADMTCPLAADFALKDWLKPPHNDAPTLAASTPRGQDVRALVFLSPDVSAANLRTGQAVLQLRNPVWGVAFLICNGSKDTLDRGTSEDIYKQVAGIASNESRVYHKTYDTKFRGTDLLGKKLQVEEHILAFLEKHLKQLPDTWQNRKSRL